MSAHLVTLQLCPGLYFQQPVLLQLSRFGTDTRAADAADASLANPPADCGPAYYLRHKSACPPSPACSAQVRLEQAENRMDLAMVADIKYGALADVEEAIKKKEAERPDNPMLAEVVGPDAIAKV